MNDIPTTPQPTLAHALALKLDNERLSELVAEKQAYIEEIDRINSNLHETISGMRRAHDSDIAIIGKTLLDEAEKRDWCDDFDTIIDEVNRLLDHPLPVRARTFQVSYVYNLSYRVSGSAEVRATSEDEARDKLLRDPEAYDAGVNSAVEDLDIDEYYDAELEVEDIV